MNYNKSMKYKTLGVLATALLLLGPGQIVYTAPVQAQQASKASDEADYQRFIHVLTHERNRWERARAATQLGIQGDARALPQLHKSLVTDISDQVRINSANAIARINKKASVTKLLRAIPVNRGKTDVQLSIIRAIGDMKDNARDVVPVLIRFLRSPSPYIREATIEALWKIREPRLKISKIFNRLLEQEEELVVKLTLVGYIADFRDPDSLPILEKIAAKSNEHVDVKTLARDAIEKLEQTVF